MMFHGKVEAVTEKGLTVPKFRIRRWKKRLRDLVRQRGSKLEKVYSDRASGDGMKRLVYGIALRFPVSALKVQEIMTEER